MNSDFILGLIAGEGSFCISIRKTGNNKSGYGIKLKFGLNMRTLDESLVKGVKNELGNIGFITYKDGRTENRGNTIQYRVSSKSECSKFVDYIERNMSQEFKSSEKYSSYLKFKEALNYIKKKDQSSPESILHLAKIRENMNDDTRYTRDYSYFKQEFGTATKVSEF